MPLHQSYQRQVLNMQCYTQQFVSGGKLRLLFFFCGFSQPDTDKPANYIFKLEVDRPSSSSLTVTR